MMRILSSPRLTLWDWLKGWRKFKTEYGELLFRKRLPPEKLPGVIFGDPWLDSQFRYRCQCGTMLTAGPRGGAAINAVCETCKINYGNLPFSNMSDPINYHAHNGTTFKADNGQLKNLTVKRSRPLDDEHLIADTIEFGAWHAMHVWPELRTEGFAGYDTLGPKVC